MARHQPRRLCPVCDGLSQQILTAPTMVKVCADVRYDSPVTGKAITNWHAREEDLKRTNCRPYDPEMRTDMDRRVQQEDADLDRAIDATIEEAVEKMSTAKRAQLASDLLDKSATLEYARSTPNAG